MLHGASIKSLFKAAITVENTAQQSYQVIVKSSLVFSNYLQLLDVLQAIPKGGNILVDLSETRLIDHSVMSALEEFRTDYVSTGGTLAISGLSSHMKFSQHPFAARKKLEQWRFAMFD